MALAPEIAELLAFIRDAPPELIGGPDATPEEGRALVEAGALLVNPPEGRPMVASEEDLTVPGPGGPVPVRVYRPEPAPHEPMPTLLWIHGGGWQTGSLDTADTVCRAMCSSARLVVVSVDYRLAPENVFPAGLDDCTAALRWIHDNIGQLGGDALRIGVGGDSAGGNLAAVLAQNTTGHDVPLAVQFLVYPATDLRTDTQAYPSRTTLATGYMLETEGLLRCIQEYLGPDTDPLDPRVSPLHGRDLASAPPALIITVEFDPLRDEDNAYADLLRAAGVTVIHQDVAGLVHGTFDMLGVSDTARTAVAAATDALAGLLAAPPSSTTRPESRPESRPERGQVPAAEARA